MRFRNSRTERRRYAYGLRYYILTKEDKIKLVKKKEEAELPLLKVCLI